MGDNPEPIMNSVEPPPISITNRLWLALGKPWLTPTKIILASSRPAIISMGKPSASWAALSSSGAFLATRKVLVATALTACGGSPRNLSPKRCKHSMARFWVSLFRVLSSDNPAPNLTSSRIESWKIKWSSTTFASWSLKLLDRKSTAAISENWGLLFINGGSGENITRLVLWIKYHWHQYMIFTWQSDVSSNIFN